MGRLRRAAAATIFAGASFLATGAIGMSSDLAEALKRQLSGGGIADASLTYRAAAGPPSRRIEIEVRLAGSGDLHWRSKDEAGGGDMRDGEIRLDAAAAEALFRLAASGFNSLIPRDQPGFRDSAVASITLEMENRTETRFFLRDSEGGSGQPTTVSADIGALVEQLEAFAK